jgi:cytochrome oxidase Cu insertion factor (SCO1/SenC/PrrC family)
VRGMKIFKRILLGLLVVIVAFAIFVAYSIYHYPRAQVETAAGQIAPDFTLTSAANRPFTLSQQRGHNVLLMFYRGYW